jgi:hypothetical protein
MGRGYLPETREKLDAVLRTVAEGVRVTGQSVGGGALYVSGIARVRNLSAHRVRVSCSITVLFGPRLFGYDQLYGGLAPRKVTNSHWVVEGGANPSGRLRMYAKCSAV